MDTIDAGNVTASYPYCHLCGNYKKNTGQQLCPGCNEYYCTACFYTVGDPNKYDQCDRCRNPADYV